MRNKRNHKVIKMIQDLLWKVYFGRVLLAQRCVGLKNICGRFQFTLNCNNIILLNDIFPYALNEFQLNSVFCVEFWFEFMAECKECLTNCIESILCENVN